MNNFERCLKILQGTNIHENAKSIFSYKNYTTFKDFLKESNYGALEKDDRLMNFYNFIVEKLIYQVRRKKEMKEVEVFMLPLYSLPQKYKHDNTTDIELTINLITKQDKYLTFSSMIFERCLSISVKHIGNSYTIDMVLHRTFQETEGQYRHQIETYLSQYSEPDILHEIKHILDQNDDKFNKKHRYITQDENLNKYYYQDQEIETFTISCLSDLKMIKRDMPEFDYNKCLKYSYVYQELVDKIPNKYLNKIRAKLADFYYKNYTVNGK